MDLARKLAILADAAKYDASCASSGSKRGNGGAGLGDTDGVGICHSYTPDGRCVSLLKILLTNWCVYDCKFCVNRRSSDTPRARFAVDEVVRLTMEFYRRNYIEGLFLSSGIIQSPDYTMEQLAEVARRLRVDEKFFGYIHLKAVPGASPELLERAGLHADRLSANVELPTDEDLRRLAPDKSMKTVTLTMSALRDRRAQASAERRESRAAPRFMPAGQSTQMVVGATPTPDRAILAKASDLYASHRLKRVYYTAFSPIPHADGALPPVTPPLAREHRLYQADWLLRFYGFAHEELFAPGEGDLRLDVDPKLAWALRHPQRFPIDVNRASEADLLRVPGFGVRTVKRLLGARRLRTLRLPDLVRLRVPMRRAEPFIRVPGNTGDAFGARDLRVRFARAELAAAQPMLFTPAEWERTRREAV
jgi:putative DNA modification/repair radical SAM protein